MGDGSILLSLRKAAKRKGWDEIQGRLDGAEVIEVTPFDANRGGLLAEYEGIRGFLPVSPAFCRNTIHELVVLIRMRFYRGLNSLVGQPMKVRILDANRKDNKLIFSEKEAVKDGLAERFAELHVGDVVKGIVTGVVDFGAFVNVDGVEGLIHISEISWERVKQPSRLREGW